MRRTNPLILGAGPAGASAAIRLAARSHRPVILERARDVPDALCGGFLSWRTLDSLHAIGVEPESLGHAQIRSVRLFQGDRRVEAALPRPAIGVSRHRLDSVLQAAALRAGAAIERGVTVRSIHGRTLHLADGSEQTPDTLFLASGKHDVRGAGRPADARGDDPTIGLRIRFGPAPALDRMIAGAIELHLFDRGYAGLVAQEDGSANLCLAVRRSRLNEAGDPQDLIDQIARECPALAERMAFRESGGHCDAVANVPYGWRARSGEAGMFRLGDQAGVIPSLAGEGIGIAIASGIAAADAFARGGGESAAAFQRDFARRTARPIALAGMLWRMGEAQAIAPWLLAAARMPGAMRLAARLTRINP